MKSSFHGAAEQVTGPCHLLEGGGARVLIDCGMFQGSRAEAEENADPVGFDPRVIDASAHADRDELQTWHEATGRPRTKFLVHGDRDGGMEAFRERPASRVLAVRCPEQHEEFDLA